MSTLDSAVFGCICKETSLKNYDKKDCKLDDET